METKGADNQVSVSKPNLSQALISCSVDNGTSLEDSRPQTQELTTKTTTKDGFEALKGLQNVRNVICVAFGALDRYYISSEDNDGEFHQGQSNVLSKGTGAL
jgi:hypothetical protein